MKHTPGPWYIKGYTSNGAACINSDRCTIATAHSPRTAQGNGEATANANLIAAAPDLLESLKALMGLWEREDVADTWDEEFRQAQQAIDKAEVQQ